MKGRTSKRTFRHVPGGPSNPVATPCQFRCDTRWGENRGPPVGLRHRAHEPFWAQLGGRADADYRRGALVRSLCPRPRLGEANAA